MGFVLWVVIGLVAGSVARLLMPGPRAGGIGVAITIGVVAALIGGLIGSALPDATSTTIDVRSLLMAINSTLIVLFIYRCLAMRAMA
jgi:uncharacterized membrane protein YeaQ/YmgE (transglycosylase-associated protein family)